jgi:cytochrome c2
VRRPRTTKIRRRVLAGAALAAVLLPGCGGVTGSRASADLANGDPARGRALVSSYGCVSCHEIEGVPGARGRVGPPLTGVGARMYIAGRLENTPENLARWVRDPKGVDEKTAMPNLGVTEQEARDIAAFLYDLRQ